MDEKFFQHLARLQMMLLGAHPDLRVSISFRRHVDTMAPHMSRFDYSELVIEADLPRGTERYAYRSTVPVYMLDSRIDQGGFWDDVYRQICMELSLVLSESTQHLFGGGQ